MTREELFMLLVQTEVITHGGELELGDAAMILDEAHTAAGYVPRAGYVYYYAREFLHYEFDSNLPPPLPSWLPKDWDGETSEEPQ